MPSPEHIPVPSRQPESTRPRKSFLEIPIGSFKGVNSLGRFASSYQRAQSFRSLEPRHNSPRSYFLDNEELYDPDTQGPSHNGRKLSTFFHDRGDMDIAVDDSASIANSLSTDIFRSDLSLHPVLSHVSDHTPLLLKKVENDKGETITIIAGQSTAPQTIFNSVNVLIGVGLLALPLGLSRAGWIFGLPFLFLCAVSTYWSANLLSECLDTDPTLMTYADLGYAAFGSKARLLISFLFSLDLLGAGVSLVVLFADSLNALFPEISETSFKMLAFCVLTPFTFLPLPVLSVISLLGITSTISLILLVFILGLTKVSSPGSLLEVMPTNLYPFSLTEFLVALGILMAPFGGHAIFPNLKVDMRHPNKFQDTLKVTYCITFLADASMAVIGFLMFGLAVKDEITKSVLLTTGYPKFAYGLMSILVAMVPLAKVPLNARPIVSILDVVFKVDNLEHHKREKATAVKKITKFALRILVNALFVILACVFPEFDKILGFLGAGISSVVCLIFPCLFYLKLCETSIKEKTVFAFFILVASVFAIVGTGAAIYY